MAVDEADVRGRRAIRFSATLLAAAALCACATSTMTKAPPAVVADLAPTGTLRAAINFGNPILATKDAATGEARGVSVDLSRELARRLGVPVELVTFTAAGKVVEGLKAGAWDVAYVAIDPARAVDMDYTAPYVLIEGAYLVPQRSPIKSNAEVDSEGVRVVVGAGSAYDLYLSRELKQAKLVRAPTSPAVTDLMVAQSYEVAAGVKQQLEADAKRVPDTRLLDGRFMVISQAMALPKGRAGGARYLAEFVEEMKGSGFVASALKRHGIEGAAVAPPGKPDLQ
jgi:polar amino acid transport system substrate-binding protein